MKSASALLSDNIARVQESIAEAALRANRHPDDINLVAVSKTVDAGRVAAAARLGLRRFGENRVQEAATKIPEVSRQVDAPLEWHLVGTLQRNKMKLALSLFAILESVDSLRLAVALNQRAGPAGVPVLLEVYLGDDPGRPGFRPDELVSQFPSLLALPGLRVRGLMTVAPFGLDSRNTRAVFARVRQLRDHLVEVSPGAELPELSMGMTDDYPLAIAEGATIVRVGRAVFGERPS